MCYLKIDLHFYDISLCQIYDILAYFSIYIDTVMIQDVITCRDRYFALKYALMEKKDYFLSFYNILNFLDIFSNFFGVK